jgi:PhnB protein
MASRPNASSVAPEWKNAVLHARMTHGGTDLLGADIPPDRFQTDAQRVSDAERHRAPTRRERVYQLLTDGGEIFMKMEETFFASRFAMLRDRFGRPG